MPKKKRIVPNLDEIGAVRSPNQPNATRYNIVGAAGPPVGPDPIAHLANSLSRFNKNLGQASSGFRQASEAAAMDKIPELLAGVDDAAANISKTLGKKGLSNFLNPATPSAATTAVGSYSGRRDVANIMNSMEFATYAQEEMDGEGDYKQKLYDFVVGQLPNRDTGNKTTSRQWKRGYDPTVLDQLEQKLQPYEEKKQLREFAEAREGFLVEGQEILKDVINARQSPEGLNAVDSFVAYYESLRHSYVTTPKSGITLRGDFLNKVVKPIFEEALNNSDTDLDALGETFEALMKSRRKTDNGSTLLFGSEAAVQTDWFNKKVDAEHAQPSLTTRRNAADQTELWETIGKPLVNGWNFIQQEHSDFLAKEQIVSLSDLEGQPDKFNKLVHLLAKEGDLKHDPAVFKRVGGLQRASLLEQMTDLYKNLAKTEIDTDAIVVKARVREALGNNFTYQGMTEDIAANMSSWLKSGKPIADIRQDMAAAVGKSLAKNNVNFGEREEVIGGYISNLMTERFDSSARKEASHLLLYYNHLLDNGIVPPDATKNIRNVISQSFTGEKDIDPDLRTLLGRLDKNDERSTYKASIKFGDVLNKVGQEAGGALFTKIAASHKIRGSASIPSEEGAWKQWGAGTIDKPTEEEQGAGRRVLEVIEKDYEEFMYEYLEDWATSPERVGKDLKEEWAKPTGRNAVEDKVIRAVLNRKDGYLQLYNNALNPADEDEQATQISSTALGPNFMPEALSLDSMYEDNFTEFGVFLNNNEVGQGALSKLTKLKSGNTAATGFYVGEIGDSRFAKSAQLVARRGKMTSDLEGLIIGLMEDGEDISKRNADGTAADAATTNRAAIRAAKAQLKAHRLKYEGVSWEDLVEGKANFNIDRGGRTVAIPVSMEDISLDSSIVFKSWEEIDKLEGLFNRWERLGTAESAEPTSFVEKDSGLADQPQEEKPLTPDEMKRLESFVGFVAEQTGYSLFDPEQKNLAEGLYNNMARKQRSMMIATDLNKLPKAANVAIKEEALHTFFTSKDNTWKGKQYTNNDKARVKAVKDYNDFIVKGKFSVEKGVTTKEFQTLYAGLVGGRMYSDIHHRRGGTGRGRGGSSTHAIPVDPSKPLTNKQKEIIAEELAMAQLGIKDPLMPSIRYRGGVHHPISVGDKAVYMAQWSKMRKLLDSKGSSPELAAAYQTLYRHTDLTKTYNSFDDQQKDWSFWKGQRKGAMDLLAPFGLHPIPLPDK